MHRQSKRRKNKISKIISQFRKLQTKKERIRGKTLLASMIFLFFGFILLIQTAGISLIIAIIGIIIVYGYYNSYKKGKRTHEANDVHYISSHCNNTFTGPHKKCPHCGGSVSCDVHRYTCTRCGHKFIAKRNSCPNCGSNLYYN